MKSTLRSLTARPMMSCRQSRQRNTCCGTHQPMESLFIYNPISMYGVLTGFLSSLNQNSVLHYAGLLALFLVTAGFLASSRSEFRSFAAGTLLVVGGFIVSLAPIMLTVPGMRTMGDQYDMLLITLSSITVLALASLMRSAVLLTGRRA